MNYFFKNVLGAPPACHIPQAVLTGMLAEKSKKGGGGGQKGFSSFLQQCAVLAQVLHDVKHYVKAYDGELATPAHEKKWQGISWFM